MDETVSGSFPIEIVKDLPPGLYRIPMKYKIKYEIEGFTDIEVEVDDYHEAIIAARSDDNKGYQPFVLINVKEGDDPSDINEPDLFAFSETPLSVGDRNVLLTVELSNLERYQISNVIPELQVGGESPLQKLNSRDPLESWLEPLEKDFILFSANDPTNSNTFELHYMLDVSNNIMPGMYTVPIMVSCLDCMNNQRFNTVYLQLNIQPNPPKFLVSEIYASTVKPNEDFNLTLTVFNSGGSDARNVTLMFNGSSNLFSAVSSIKGPEHIKKGEQENFVFKLQASDLEPGSKHTLSFFVTCEDCLGNIQTYDKNPELSIPIMVKKFNPSFAPRFIISETTTTSIKPNSDFTLRVKLLNCGGSTAQNVKVMFNGSSNLFLAEDRMKSLPSISRNQEGLSKRVRLNPEKCMIHLCMYLLKILKVSSIHLIQMLNRRSVYGQKNRNHRSGRLARGLP